MNMQCLLRPLSMSYGGITGFRNDLYNRGWLRSAPVSCPVISVGNITTGGTGKTPIVDHLVNWVESQGLRPGIVLRGYKGQFSGEQKVELSEAGVHFGDEPTLLARRHPNVPVYVGAKRSKVVRKLLAEQSVDLVFADDAFQHRALCRNLDIVLIDAQERLENYQLLPEGRLREPMRGMARADFIILTRVNLATEAQREQIIQLIGKKAGIKREAVLQADFKLTEVREWLSGRAVEDWKTRSCIGVTGIGRPESFLQLVEREKVNLVEHFSFPDHHHYTSSDIERIEECLNNHAADWILTTDKDAVKLQGYASLRKRLLSVQLGVHFSENAEVMYEKILALVHS